MMRIAVALLAMSGILGKGARAQACDSSSAGRFVVVGSIADHELKRDELAGCVRRSLIRSPTTLSQDLSTSGWRLSYEVVPPQTSLVRNSAIPYSMNDGAQWAGRGMSATALTGLRFKWWRISGAVVPEIMGTSNDLFNFRPATFPGRSAFSSWVNTNLPS